MAEIVILERAVKHDEKKLLIRFALALGLQAV